MIFYAFVENIIPKELNLNSHVCNAWLNTQTITTNHEVVEYLHPNYFYKKPHSFPITDSNCCIYLFFYSKRIILLFSFAPQTYKNYLFT